MTPEQIAEVVGRLGAAERAALLRLKPHRHYPYSALTGVTRQRLFARNVLQFVGDKTMEIAPLGELVRIALVAGVQS